MFTVTFHEKLSRLLRDAMKTKICRRAGITPGTLNNLLRRGSIPRIDTAAKLARALEVDLSWMLDDSAGWPPVRKDEVAACGR